MSAAQHTPGPWKAIPPRIGAAITVYATDGQIPIATTCSNTSPATMEMHRSGEVKANAALIAAAPDLLAALQNLVEQPAGSWPFILRQNAIAAIAKATGSAG